MGTIAVTSESYNDDYISNYISYFYDFLTDSQIEIGKDGREKLDKVFSRISKNFNGKNRKSGEPYVTHLIEVAKIFIELVGISNINYDDIIIALLHDSIEDIEHENFHSIQKDFGDYVALGVLALSKKDISNTPGKGEEKRKRNKEYYSRFKSLKSLQNHIIKKSKEEDIHLSEDDIIQLSLTVAKIKLCDRIHNLRTMKLKQYRGDKKGFTPEKKEEKIKESISCFSTLLKEVGNDSIKNYFSKAILFGIQSLVGHQQRLTLSFTSS